MAIEPMRVRLRWRIQDIIDKFDSNTSIRDPRFEEQLCLEVERFLTLEGIDINDTTKKG